MTRATVVYNDDGQTLIRLSPDRPIEYIHRFLEWTIQNIPMDVYELNCALPDTCFYPSKAGEQYGIHKPVKARSAHGRGVAYLQDAGTNLLEVYAKYLRPRGIRLLAEMRMNDTHFRSLDGSHDECSRFAMEHPEYLIQRPDGVEEVALDYAYEEVREHRFAILAELIETGCVDGLSLNFNRWAKHFNPGFGPEHTPIMTAFVRRVRKALDDYASQHGLPHMLLGVRVPSTLHECLLAGCDVAAWIRNNDVDYVIPSEHNCTWPGLNIEQFKACVNNDSCMIYASMSDMIGGMCTDKPDPEPRGNAIFPGRTGYHSMLNTPQEARGAALNFYEWGADGIGFWNIPNNCNPFGQEKYSPEHIPRILDWIHTAIDISSLRKASRRYHYVPLYRYDPAGKNRNYKYLENGRSPHGEFKGQVLHFTEGTLGIRQSFSFRMADGRGGQPLKGTFRFRICLSEKGDEFDVDINNVPISELKQEKRFERDDEGFSWCWILMDLVDCPPLRGDNELGIVYRTVSEPSSRVPRMEELDIIVEPI